MMKQRLKEKLFEKTEKWVCTLLLSLIFMVSASAQDRVISGTVLDASGATLPGVNVTIKGTATGTVTDINGKYSIKVTGSTATISFTFVGYVSQDIQVADQTSINITLAEDVQQLNEVVVIGYGVQRKSDLTGAIASVSGSKLKDSPVPSIDQALQGRAAGVSVVSNSGMPGGSVTIQIRGVSSVNGTAPLVVIDGVPGGDLSRISPSDIESIEVLKDAGSAAIYGSSGGNGVLLVSTKKGKLGKPSTNVNYYYGIENVANKVEMMNSKEWNDAYTDESLIMSKGAIRTPFTTQPDTLPSYDWNNFLFKQAITQNVDVSVAGGSETSTYFISANYMKQDGLVKNTGFEKLSFLMNSQQKLTKHISFDQKVSFSNDITTGFEEWEWNNEYLTPLIGGYRMWPYLKPYKDNGDYNAAGTISSPFVRINNKDRTSKHVNIEGTAGINIEIIKGLNYSSHISGKLPLTDIRGFNPEIHGHGVLPADEVSQNKLVGEMRRDFSWTYQNLLTFNKTILDDHNFTVMGGMEASRFWYYNIRGERLGFTITTPEMLYFTKSNNTVATSQFVDGTGSEQRRQAYFGRLMYDYKGMVLLQYNERRDGNSSFGPNFRWGRFWSMSGGFKFSELEAIKNLGILSLGKLRYSYGQSGQFPRSNWPFLSRIVTPTTYMYSFDNTTNSVGAGFAQIPNPDIHWETDIDHDAGIDLNFFSNQFTVSIDYYKKLNNAMLMYKGVNATAGVFQQSSANEGGDSKPEINYGSVENSGMELQLGFNKTVGDFKFNADANLTTITNKITKLATDSFVPNVTLQDITGLTIQKEGQAIGTFWGFQRNGIFKETDAKVVNVIGGKGKLVFADQAYTVSSKGDTVYAQRSAKAGDVKWKDNNGDGKIGDADRVYLGSPIPKFTYGFSLGVTYKWIDVNCFFQGSYGNKILNGLKRYTWSWDNYGNRAKAFANRYRIPYTDAGGNVIDAGNTNTEIPAMGEQNYKRMSDFYIEDGSYLRLKTMTIGFTLPASITQKIKIERFRVYMTVNNVYTWTKYTGLDPEVGNADPNVSGIDIAGYPSTRMMTFGANLSF